jgi:hypothetical protein
LRLSEPGDGLDKPGSKGVRNDEQQVHQCKYKHFNEMLADGTGVRFQTRTLQLSLSAMTVARLTGIHLASSQISIKIDMAGYFMYVLSTCFLDAFAKLQKATIRIVMSLCLSVRPSVLLSAWTKSAPTGRIFIKFGV